MASMLAFIGLLLFTYGWLPWLVRHSDLALPAIGGLPYYITYAGRRYATSECRPSAACRGYHACVTQSYLIAQGLWPLAPAGAISSFVGPDVPILAGPLPRDGQGRQIGVRFTLVVPNGAGCYVVYGLQGGP
ncbi:MAG TPA: hypothetical protein VFM49_19525 [Chloroflexia bacterium]|nr:hypothetical protein [Chloroflexia bacterium]